MDRRKFLGSAVAGVGAFAFGAPAARAFDLEGGLGESSVASFAMMPWSGGVTEDSAVVIAQATSSSPTAELLVSESADLSSPTVIGPINADSDGWFRFEVESLDPDTQYFYGAALVGGGIEPSRIGRFRTHPPVGQPASFKMAVISDAGHAGAQYESNRVSGSPAWEFIKQQDPLMCAFIGDFHYKDLGTPTQALAESITEYQAAYTEIQNAPYQSTFWRDIPMAFIFDNHDSQQEGFANSPTSYTSPGVDPTYRQCIPSYPVEEGKLWQSWQIGRVLFIMTDNRSHRSGNAPLPNRMFGDEQKQWFYDLLLSQQAEDAALIVWLQADPWRRQGASGDWSGGWESFPHDRVEVGNFIESNGLSDKLVTFTGHTHISYYHTFGSMNEHGGFREIGTGGLDVIGGFGRPGSWTDLSPMVAKSTWTTLEVVDDGDRVECVVDFYDWDHQWGRHRFFHPPLPATAEIFEPGSYDWQVPPGITEIHFDVMGAGTTQTTGLGGRGHRVQGKLEVTPEETLRIYVGSEGSGTIGGWAHGSGADGGNGGAGGLGGTAGQGGGAASEIRQGGTALGNRVVVGSGGGGNAGNQAGGGGGHPSGIAGTGGLGNPGTQTNHGDGGTDPSRVRGSNGNSTTTLFQSGGAGGGGGYFGGRGGASSVSTRGGGGGGSGYVDPSVTSDVLHTNSFRTRNGRVQIWWGDDDEYYDLGAHQVTVPAGATSVDFDVRGAKGGDGRNGNFGGKGARVQGTLTVTPGDILYLYIGHRGRWGDTNVGTQFGGGANGGNGGATGQKINGCCGGAATDIRLNDPNVSGRVVVAGAGGGASMERSGGGGGFPNGLAGEQGNPGGSQTQDGHDGQQIAGRAGQAGTIWINGSGGGGGGWRGGGGGWRGSAVAGGGSGGSSWTHPTLVTNVTHTNNENPAPGSVRLSWNA